MFPLYKWGGFGATSPSRVGWFWEAFTEGQNAPTLEGEVAKGPHCGTWIVGVPSCQHERDNMSVPACQCYQRASRVVVLQCHGGGGDSGGGDSEGGDGGRGDCADCSDIAPLLVLAKLINKRLRQRLVVLPNHDTAVSTTPTRNSAALQHHTNPNKTRGP